MKPSYNLPSTYRRYQPTYGIPQYPLGGTLTGAASGASLGTAIFPGIGTAIGAVGGALVGLFTGMSKKRKQEEARNKFLAQQQEEKRLLKEQNDKATLANWDAYGTPDISYYRDGGTIDLKEGLDYEVEGNEVVQGQASLESGTPLASDLLRADGPSHEGGGVGGVGGERVFSDRLKPSEDVRNVLDALGLKKVKGNSYASVAEQLGKEKGKMESKLASQSRPSINTAEQTIPKLDAALDILFEAQESSKKQPYRRIESEQFQDGGSIFNEDRFNRWFKHSTVEGRQGISPNDPNIDYDYKSYYKDMIKGNTPYIDIDSGNGHLLDTYKLPNHPSFSVESKNFRSIKETPNALSYDGNFKRKFRTGGPIKPPSYNLPLQAEMLSENDERYLATGKKAYSVSDLTDRQRAGQQIARDMQYTESSAPAAVAPLPTIPTSFTSEGPGVDWNSIAGHVGNLGSYLSNRADINRLNTNVNRNYMPMPVYDYRDRSGTARRDINRMVRTGQRALGTSSRTVNAANQGAIMAQGLQAQNAIQQAENERRDRYDNMYQNRVWQTQAANAGIANQASDMRRELYNNKRVYAPNQARNAFMQGVAGNEQNRMRKTADQQRLAIHALLNDHNGVLSRATEKYPEVWELLKKLGY